MLNRAVKTLVVWGSGPPSAAARRLREDTRLVAWGEKAEESLRKAAVPHGFWRPTPEDADAVDEAAIAWTKAWGKRPILDGRSFRDLLSWKGTSLWWFGELYLHHCTRSPRYVRLIEAFHRLLDREQPAEVEAVGLDRDEAVLLGRTCVSRGVLFHGPRSAPAMAVWLRTLGIDLRARWNALKARATAIKTAIAGPPPRPPDVPSKRPVLFVSHAAFWRKRMDPETGTERVYEHYFDRLIPAVDADPSLSAFVVAIGPRTAFRRRGWGKRCSEWLRSFHRAGADVHINAYLRFPTLIEIRRATAMIRRAWKRLRDSPGVAEAFTHRGVRFGDLAGPDLAGTLLLQLSWAVRSYEEMSQALGETRPEVACLYAESSGWGRAVLAACRAAGIPTVAVQHGILYPKYYSYLHAADEVDCPRPDKTALFGEAARGLLIERGHYPESSLVLTGSPKFDDLITASRQWDRRAIRASMGIEDGECALLVASRYRGIRQTHQSIGSAFPGLIRAVESIPEIQCLVKPHPAEGAEAYARDIREAGATRVRLLPSGSDLLELLNAADALVTVESLSAIEALVLCRPILILNMPTNLRELVERGVAIGVKEGDDPSDALRCLLFDATTRARLNKARDGYLSFVACGVDGKATERILSLIRETAERGERAAAGVVGC